MTGVAVARGHYRVNLSTPVGARNDYAYIDMYFEEVGGADDPDLIHAFAAPSESSRRWKVRQIIRVLEGYTEVPIARFTDIDGTPHAIVPIAIIARTATSTITQAMITDIRRDVSGFVDIKEEVIEARGNRGVLGDRLSQSMAPNGDILSTAAVTALSAVAPMLMNGGAGPVTGTVSASMPAATAALAGYMTQAFASKLDNIQALAQVNQDIEDSDSLVTVAAPVKLQFDKRYFTVTEPAANEALIEPANGLTVAGYSAETNYKVVPADTPTNQLKILKGILGKTDNSGFIVRLANGVAVTGIGAVTVSGQERYDIVEVTDTGTIVYTEGSQQTAGATIPEQATMDASLPAPTATRSVLAIVVVQYNGGGVPAVTKDHIVDARPLIRNYRASTGFLTDHAALTANMGYATAGHTGFSPTHTTHVADQMKYYYGIKLAIHTGTHNFDITSAGFLSDRYIILVGMRMSGSTALVSWGFGWGNDPGNAVGMCSSAISVVGQTSDTAFYYDSQTKSNIRAGKIVFSQTDGVTNFVDYTISGATPTQLQITGTISGSDPYPSNTYDMYVVLIGQ